jgi:hypothetical protein
MAQPSHEEMFVSAILALKDKQGLSAPQIANYLAANYSLPESFEDAILSTQLKYLCRSGKLFKEDGAWVIHDPAAAAAYAATKRAEEKVAAEAAAAKLAEEKTTAVAAAAKLAAEKAAAEAAALKARQELPAALKAQQEAACPFAELALWRLEAENVVGTVNKQTAPASQYYRLPPRAAVHHVVNPVLHAAYERKKKALAARLGGAANVNERFLFHGTSMANSEAIIRNNFCLSKVRNTITMLVLCGRCH